MAATKLATINATDNLAVEVWPGEGATDPAVLKIKDRVDDRQYVFVLLNEVTPLTEALDKAAAMLATRGHFDGAPAYAAEIAVDEAKAG
jgi:hypothetical protein